MGNHKHNKEETVSVEYKDYPTQIGTIQRPYFTVDGTSNYTIKAIFAAKDYGDVNVTVMMRAWVLPLLRSVQERRLQVLTT